MSLESKNIKTLQRSIFSWIGTSVFFDLQSQIAQFALEAMRYYPFKSLALHKNKGSKMPVSLIIVFRDCLGASSRMSGHYCLPALPERFLANPLFPTLDKLRTGLRCAQRRVARNFCQSSSGIVFFCRIELAYFLMEKGASKKHCPESSKGHGQRHEGSISHPKVPIWKRII